MNTLEDRVRAALRVRAEDFSADPDALARIRTRAQAARRRRGRPRSSAVGRFLIPTAAAAAVVAIVAAVTVTVNGISGRPTGAPAASTRSLSPTTSASRPAGGLSGPPTPFLQPGQGSLIVTARPPSTSEAGPSYFWLGGNSPAYSRDQIQLCHITTDVPGGSGGGFCWPLPGPPAGQPATVTGNEGEGVAGKGMRMAVGTAAGQVYTLIAVSDDGRAYPGTVVARSGFPYEAWAVSYPASSRVRLVFLNAKGRLAATLSPAGPSGLPQTPLPISGGVPVFHYTPGADAPADTTLGYLIGGRVGFISPLRGMVLCELPASSAPALGALLEPLDNFRGGDWQPVEAFGYAHADVARVVLHLPGGREVSTPTFAAGLAGSDLRLWAVPMPFVIRNERPLPSVTATGESATGQVLGQVQLGRVE
jgi:hypothetical protein